jgi:hypothetical protein
MSQETEKSILAFLLSSIDRVHSEERLRGIIAQRVAKGAAHFIEHKICWESHILSEKHIAFHVPLIKLILGKQFDFNRGRINLAELRDALKLPHDSNLEDYGMPIREFNMGIHIGLHVYFWTQAYQWYRQETNKISCGVHHAQSAY